MIKANELRIGNWVYDEDNAYAKVEILRSDRFIEWNGGDDEATNISLPNDKAMYGGNINPIPLTPEILEKCGFEKKQWTTKGIEITCYYYQLKNIVVYPLKGFFEIELITIAGQFNMFKSWNYLHQLQNLYFALTNEELTFKP